jgi:lipoprotein NlpI
MLLISVLGRNIMGKRRSAALLLAALLPLVARADTPDEYLQKSRAAWKRGETKEALQLATKAVEADPKNSTGWLLRGSMHEVLGQHDDAVADFDRCLELDPKNADALDHRGSEQFRRGRIAESLADFDAFLKLRPAAAPGHWKRGISLYYLGRYDEGRRQFGRYEEVDTNDVENAVWHFLCAARKDGIEKAQKAMLKIGKDRRVPMMEVYDLFRGMLRPADVLAAAEAGDVPAAERRSRLFYAHLYLGLWHDVRGETKEALEHLELAAGKYGMDHYMGDVARVHRDILKKKS